MPAIDLARLKKQTAQLADLFDQPGAFLRELREVLEFYVNRTLRSLSVAPSSVLPTYRTPVAVLRTPVAASMISCDYSGGRWWCPGGAEDGGVDGGVGAGAVFAGGGDVAADAGPGCGAGLGSAGAGDLDLGLHRA